MNKNSQIAVLGFGLEGEAMMKWLLKHGYSNVTICDRNVDLKDDLPSGVSTNLGESYLDDLEKFDIIFRSPGVKYLEPNIQIAIGNQINVMSVTTFFMDQCPCPVIGVTGTKGKGTTSTLIYEILKEAGKTVYLGGNIGEPAINFLDHLKGSDLMVLEMSSFQLQDLKKSPKYAVLLNTTTDHLDYHADRDEYLEAKEAILVHQNENCVAVLNKDYEYVKYYKPLLKGDLREVSVKEKVKNGAYVEGDSIYFAKNGEKEKIIGTKEVGLIGSHNFENVMPAIVIAKELGVSTNVMAEVIRKFKGLPHRLEFVEEIRGVKYYNDSFSTAPEPSMAAVDSFDEPTVLIAGGFDKGLDYDEWAVKILTKPSLEVVILMGGTADKMENSLKYAEEKLGEAEGSPTKIFRAKDLSEAVKKGADYLKNGGVVVMSPAGSSFDLYHSYKERGEKFREAVGKLKP